MDVGFLLYPNWCSIHIYMINICTFFRLFNHLCGLRYDFLDQSFLFYFFRLQSIICIDIHLKLRQNENPNFFIFPIKPFERVQ